MPQHYFHAQDLGFGALGYVVLLSYLLTTAFLVITIRDGFRAAPRTCGMPPLGLFSILAVCVIVVVGPFTNQSHLFFPPSNWGLLAMWAVWVVLLSVILGQYLAYGSRETVFAGRGDVFVLLTAVQFTTILIGFWTFIVYYQDWYVNEICLVATLVLSGTYFVSIFMRQDLQGQSVPGAWFLALGNALLFGAMVAGNMSDPFPEAEYGYSFIYWMFAVTLVLNVAYAVALRERKRTGAPAAVSAEGILV